MKKDVVRTSFDLSTDTLQQADKIVKEAKLDSRKHAVEWSIRLASQVVEAVRQGLRLVVVNKDGEEKDFQLDKPSIDPRSHERLILARISQENIYKLLEMTKDPNHPAASVSAQLGREALRPNGPHFVGSHLFFSLIYGAITKDDPAFLSLVRDVVTGCVTAFKSFQDMLDAENYTPYFDVNFPEQKFLADEYQKEKRKVMLPNTET